MNYEEYTNKIENLVSTLDQKERVAVILICCFRLSPLYSQFYDIEKWGNKSLLKECRELAINWFKGISVDSSSLSDKVEKVIPDSEDFGTVLGSYALNAGVAHLYLLDQIKENDPSFLFYVLRNCYDTVDLYVHECLDPDCKGGISEAEIENHPAVLNEINWQFGIFSAVKSAKDIVKFIEELNIEPILKLAA